MTDSAFGRRFFITLLVVGAAVPLLLWGTLRSARSMFNDPTQWVPTTFPQRRSYEWFVESFECEDAVVLSWPGCTLDDPRLQSLEQELTGSHEPDLSRQCSALVERVVTGHSVLEQLTERPISLSRKAAIGRLKGTLIGPDERTSCAMVILTPTGARQRAESIEMILGVAESAVGLDRQSLYVTGLPIDGYTIDQESIRSLSYYAIPSMLVAWMICCVCLGRWRFTLVVVVVGAIGACLAMTLVSLSGRPMNAVLIIMPPLLFVLTVSGGVHLINYYDDEVRLRGAAGSVRRAMAQGWMPCALAAVTTAIGLASLAVSDIVPVRMFGTISTIGILATVVLLFLTLPGAMVLCASGLHHRARAAEQGPSTGVSPPACGWLATLSRLVCRHNLAIVPICLALMAVAACGLWRLETSVSIRSLLSPGSRVMRDYRWMEAHVGPMVPVEVILHFDKACRLDPLRRVEIVRGMQRHIASMDAVDGVTSAATFLPPVPQRTWGQVVFRRELEACCPSLLESKYLAEEPGRQSWRINGRVPALAKMDYGRFLHQLDRRVEAVLADLRRVGIEGMSATCTGMMPLVDEAQRALLHDLFGSFLLAFATVSLVMVVFLRSIWAGLLAMLPNAFPSIVLFGTLGWLHRPIDIGSVMTASVAMGIAVDGTLHFLTWYRREMDHQVSRAEAVRRCFGHCGRAMVQTTIICGLGMLVFAFSGFMPARSFAWMILTLLAAALVGDFVLLPAILVGPLGRLFTRRRASFPAKTPHLGTPQPAQLAET